MGKKVVASKYRGSVEYFRVFAHLVKAAERGKTITYQEIAEIMGLPSTGSYMGRETGWMLGEISEDEHDRGRPMLSAVAISALGRPGRGFADLATRLGRLPGGSTVREFWLKECECVYRTWKPAKGTKRRTGK